MFYSSAVLINIPLVLIYGIILCLTGVVMYAYFANDGCDPLAEGAVTNGNQVKARIKQTHSFVVSFIKRIVLAEPADIVGETNRMLLVFFILSVLR